jgi:hypothetical protein
MTTLTKGVIESIKVPAEFSELTEQAGGKGPDYRAQIYRIPAALHPDITLRYSGSAVHPSGASAFRKLLSMPPQTIFETDNPACMTGENLELAKAVSPALGNAGDNQIKNTAKGFEGPTFRLAKLAVVNINSRAVLRVRGWFHKPDSAEPKVFLDCIFSDTDPGSKDCKLEELYLQCSSAQQFGQYLPEFETVLSSISWSA